MGNRTPWLGFDPQQKGGRAHAGLPCKFCKGGVSQAPHGTAKIKMPCDSGVILFCCMSYGESNTVVGVRPAAKRRAGARRFALQILQGRRQPSPARDCQNKKRRLVRRFLFCCMSHGESNTVFLVRCARHLFTGLPRYARNDKGG